MKDRYCELALCMYLLYTHAGVACGQLHVLVLFGLVVQHNHGEGLRVGAGGVLPVVDEAEVSSVPPHL